MANNEDPQIIAKKAVKKLGLQIHFCYECMMIQCIPGDKSNWVSTGCGCCKLDHNLLEDDPPIRLPDGLVAVCRVCARGDCCPGAIVNPQITTKNCSCCLVDHRKQSFG